MLRFFSNSSRSSSSETSLNPFGTSTTTARTNTTDQPTTTMNDLSSQSSETLANTHGTSEPSELIYEDHPGLNPSSERIVELQSDIREKGEELIKNQLGAGSPSTSQQRISSLNRDSAPSGQGRNANAESSIQKQIESLGNWEDITLKVKEFLNSAAIQNQNKKRKDAKKLHDKICEVLEKFYPDGAAFKRALETPKMGPSGAAEGRGEASSSAPQQPNRGIDLNLRLGPTQPQGPEAAERAHLDARGQEPAGKIEGNHIDSFQTNKELAQLELIQTKEGYDSIGKLFFKYSWETLPIEMTQEFRYFDLASPWEQRSEG